MNDNWEIKAIHQQLKDILKHKKMSYRILAEKMKVSEITIKRFFTSSDLSFTKLQQICDVIGISALELIALVNKGNEQSFHLSEAQELHLSKNESLYNFFVFLLKSGSLKAATQKGQFDKENVPRFLRELKNLDLIELPIGDFVHVKKRGVLTWRKGGPLQKKFMRKRHVQYLDVFENGDESDSTYLTSSQRHMRPESLAEMKRDLEFIAQKFRNRAYIEETTCSEDQLIGVAWMMGLGKYEH